MPKSRVKKRRKLTSRTAAARKRLKALRHYRSREMPSWGADLSGTRFSPLDQINAENFNDLDVAWIWRGDNFGPTPDNILRATPTYINGRLYTVAGARRTVAAIDPATGETLWTFREPHTERFERSMRQNYGKGVAFDPDAHVGPQRDRASRRASGSSRLPTRRT